MYLGSRRLVLPRSVGQKLSGCDVINHVLAQPETQRHDERSFDLAQVDCRVQTVVRKKSYYLGLFLICPMFYFKFNTFT